MDAKRFYDKAIYDNLKERLRIKIEERGEYDLVLTSDDDALNFVLHNYMEFFPNTPVVFWGFDNIEKIGYLDSITYVTGVMETLPARENIELIKRIHPNVDEIIAFYDSTSVGIIDFRIYDALKKDYPDMVLSEICTNNFSLNELQDTIGKLREDQLIIKFSSYQLKDMDLNLYEQIELLYNDSPVPVYCWGTVEIVSGFFGGCLSDYYEQATLACHLAKNVLNGADISKMKIVSKLPCKKIVNYSALKKYHIPDYLLPDDVVVLGAPSKKLNIRKDLFFIIVFSLITALILLGINIRLAWAKRRLADNLRDSQQNYEILFRENPSVNLLIDPGTGQIADANNAALKFYGYTIGEIKKLNITEVSALPLADTKEKIHQAQVGFNRDYVSRHRKKNGELRDVEVFIDQLNLPAQSFLYANVTDITERLETEREMIEARQKAEESDRLKSAFLANMSHEIRTPMNSILGFSDLLINGEGYPGKNKEYLKMIHTNGNHLLALINDVIDISRIEANQLKIIKKETKINVLIDELFIEFNNRRIQEKSDFILEVEKGSKNPDFEVITDGIRLKQILINLIGNAFKFTEKGFVQFGYKIREDGMLQFFVKDSGIGIPKDKQDIVFSVFQRLDDSYTKNYSGAGLGLSIAKSLVEKLGGHIWLMSDIDQGSRFYFTIPGAEEKLKM
jgi:PAS domain S-box-containing protein